ncbi:MAG: phosphoenolpyruvate carboxykinase (ATP) [Elusimicrobiaceae bacterium]
MTTGLENLGIANTGRQYWNLSVPSLIEEAVKRGEGVLAEGGAFAVFTGKTTGRSPKYRFFVEEAGTKDKIYWNKDNTPVSEEKFERLFSRFQAYLENRDVFVRDCYVGADKESRLSVRVVNEAAWHNLFVRNMFIRPDAEALKTFNPDFTVISLPNFKADPQRDGSGGEIAIYVSFERKMVLVAASAYGGEMKKAIFTVMNYLLPLKGIMSMHCSANIGKKGDTALFFGLSGTGKTTLSADPQRGLIGDDEHGWSDKGVFNYEGGCYAKIINLSKEAEPQIYACTKRFGTIIENAVYNKETGVLDLFDGSVTENTRACYPLEFIDNAVEGAAGGHPENIVMLTCDAFGVMPPIARLSVEQAMYHFISGYTAKVAGTEVGLKEPQATFSACFGAPFMVLHPSFYAELLKKKMLKHGAKCWLVNTGWIGGAYGTGNRISIKHTRALLNAALDGKLNSVKYEKDSVFGFDIPTSCEGVPPEILRPAGFWKDQAEYYRKYRELAFMFVKNFERFKNGCSREICDAGPVCEKTIAG